MSTFTVSIKRIAAIEPHPNADAIEIAVIDGYRCITKKGQFQAGALVAYLPEASLLPQWLLKELGFWDEVKGGGTLNGPEGNRVKAIKLRGVLSQGLCYTAEPLRALTPQGLEVVDVQLGQDVGELLGVSKYEPPIPVSMSGEVFNAGAELTLGFDVENWKAYPNILQDGEEVIFTEKLHGTCTVIAILPFERAHPEAFGQRRNILIFSKGLGAKGLVLKNNPSNQDNLYVRATRKLIERIDEVQLQGDGVAVPTFFLGETYGPGVQDLSYGKDLGLRIFAAAFGYRGSQQFLNWSNVEGSLKETFSFETVPVLYRGPFSKEVMAEHTSGKTTLGGGHIREGIVMMPAQERWDAAIGRVCLKSVSADYLTRKGGTEFS